eukprot:maker-scaffold394_size185225-snap-gene-0.26 protein:Tk12267 transcript:maker-scaffold394_size185225-snap-gene-0.26-mRNA-1 annotation:"calcium and integrin-binding protein 1-like"
MPMACFRCEERFSSLSNDGHRIPMGTFLESFQELKENPFGSRICEVFSTQSDFITLEDLLDLCSAFSPGATDEAKMEWAFKIFDYDNDGNIGKEDLTQAINDLTSNMLEREEVKTIIDKTLPKIGGEHENVRQQKNDDIVSSVLTSLTEATIDLGHEVVVLLNEISGGGVFLKRDGNG